MTTSVPKIPVDPRIWKRRVAVMREQGRKRLRIVVGVLAALLVASGGLVALHSSLFAARHLNVVGAVHTPVGEVLATSGLSNRPPLVDIDASEVVAAHRGSAMGEERGRHRSSGRTRSPSC